MISSIGRPMAMLGAVAALISACGSAPAAAPLDVATPLDATVHLGTPTRTFVFRKPRRMTLGAPLVIVLHGTPGTGRTMEQLTQFDRVADAQGFLVAYPNSLDAGTILGRWQVGCCTATLRGTADLLFLSDLIDYLARTERIDRRRVYVVGFSLGGAMAYRVACELSSKVAAIASVGGFEYLSACRPGRPVSVYEIHGTGDYFGGSCGGQTQTDRGCGFGDPGYEPSVDQTNRQWRRIDGCAPNERVTRFSSVTRQLWAQCQEHAAVQLDVIEHGTHCYPTPSACGDYDATAAIWRFLRPRSLAASTHASGGA